MAKAKPVPEDPGQQGLFGKEGELYGYMALRVVNLADEIEAVEKKLKITELYLKALNGELEKVKAMKKGLEATGPVIEKP